MEIVLAIVALACVVAVPTLFVAGHKAWTRAERLEAYCKEVEASNESLHKALAKQLQMEQSEISRYRVAVEFYGNPEHWRSPHPRAHSKAVRAKWYVARAALHGDSVLDAIKHIESQMQAAPAASAPLEWTAGTPAAADPGEIETASFAGTEPKQLDIADAVATDQ